MENDTTTVHRLIGSIAPSHPRGVEMHFVVDENPAEVMIYCVTRDEDGIVDFLEPIDLESWFDPPECYDAPTENNPIGRYSRDDARRIWKALLTTDDNFTVMA